jgi:hypothetical protein
MDNDTLIRILKECEIYDRIMLEIEQIEHENYK